MKATCPKGITVPEIYISKNKSRLKVYNTNDVFLNNGDNFEIELFNNQLEDVGFEISMNGKLISSSLLILKPAQRFFLDRFLDTNNKFLFETYKVDNNEEVKSIIANNGVITIKCYKEEYINKYNNLQTVITYPSYPYWYGTGSRTIGNNLSGTITTSSVYMNNANNITYTANLSDNTMPINSVFTCSSSLETGKVEKGGESEQKFDTTYFNPSNHSFHQITYQILPSSMNGIRKADIKQYCSCGTRIRKQTWKFCPKCGAEI